MTSPKLYRCTKCSNTVIIELEAEVLCLRCARAMEPVGEKLSRDNFSEDLAESEKCTRVHFSKTLQA
jgi:DNA-directed RNA polymerase subunit RPC12/RpoP